MHIYAQISAKLQKSPDHSGLFIVSTVCVLGNKIFRSKLLSICGGCFGISLFEHAYKILRVLVAHLVCHLCYGEGSGFEKRYGMFHPGITEDL